MPRKYTMPKDWDKMPIGFYLRIKRSGALSILGQKSEMPHGRAYQVWGPIPLPKDGPRPAKHRTIPVPEFDGAKWAIEDAIRELTALK